MRYTDIKLCESPKNRGERWCRTLNTARDRIEFNPNGLKAAIRAATAHMQRYPDDAPFIQDCLNAAIAAAKGFTDNSGTAIIPGSSSGRGTSDNVSTVRGDGDGDTTSSSTVRGDGDDSTSNSAAAAAAAATQGGSASDGEESGAGGDGDTRSSEELRRAADELQGLLDAEDWQGARDLIDSNPDLKALVPAEMDSDLNAAIQAQADAEAAAEAAEAAEAEARRNRENEEAKAAADAAEEAAARAAEIEAARIRAAERAAEEAAARAAEEEAAAERAARAADDARQEAERLETEQEEAGGTLPSDTPPKATQDTYTWDELKP